MAEDRQKCLDVGCNAFASKPIDRQKFLTTVVYWATRNGTNDSATSTPIETNGSAAMPATLEAVAHDALILPPDQRLALARQLLESVDLEPEPGAEAAWEAEIARRIARFKSGESVPIPAGEVFARLRQIAPDR